ncbi:mucin-19-like [Discoglossus pictus]
MKNMACIDMCAEGCFCKDGLVLLKKDSNICVEKSKCPNKDCPENMEFTTCGTLCPRTCDNKDALINCLAGCSDKKCICKEGYVLLNQSSNICVTERECPVKVCPENQVYQTCGTKCPSTCDNYMEDMACIDMCAEGCFCKDGLVLLNKDSNICVEKSKCPNKDCPENMEFNPCGTLCPRTCDNKDYAMKCIAGCSKNKCFCKEGYVLLNQNSNICVRESECPIKEKQPSEVVEVLSFNASQKASWLLTFLIMLMETVFEIWNIFNMYMQRSYFSVKYMKYMESDLVTPMSETPVSLIQPT